MRWIRNGRSGQHPGAGQWRSSAQPPLSAFADIDFDLHAGETLALVGESGCGKTSLAKALLRLTEASAGRILFQGEDLRQLGARQMRLRRRDLQIIFQDPCAALNPRMRVEAILAEPLKNFGLRDAAARTAHVQALLQQVGLGPETLRKHPHELSGGQRQRLGIARALALQPQLIVCDEPLAQLDVSVQAQVLNLLMDLQQALGLALLFISHDLAVVRHISHRVAVMLGGRIVEMADNGPLFDAPRHPYTEMLLAAMLPAQPVPWQKSALDAAPAETGTPAIGCAFQARCPLVQAVCRAVVPVLSVRASEGGGEGANAPSWLACHLR